MSDWDGTGPGPGLGDPVLIRTDVVLSSFSDFSWLSQDATAGTHRGFGHVPPLGDVLAVLLVRHADPLLGHHVRLLGSAAWFCWLVLLGDVRSGDEPTGDFSLLSTYSKS